MKNDGAIKNITKISLPISRFPTASKKLIAETFGEVVTEMLENNWNDYIFDEFDPDRTLSIIIVQNKYITHKEETK